MNASATLHSHRAIPEYLSQSCSYFALPHLSIGILTGPNRLDIFAAPQNTATESIYKVGSLTKLVTALAILKLQEANALTLADSVARYVPWFDTKASNPVTIRDLLLHLGGLPRGDFYNSNPSADQVRQSVEASRPAHDSKGRGGFKYSNLGYTLLGIVIEQASRTPYAEFVKSLVFSALNMEHSGFGNECYGRQLTPPHRLSCFSRTNSTPYDCEAMPLLAAPHASFDMFSTVEDFSALLSCLLDGGLNQQGERVFEAASIATLFGTSHAMNRRVHAGPGFYTLDTPGGRAFYENGEHFGHSASMLMIPEQKFAVVAMANRGSAGQDLSCIVNAITRYHNGPDRAAALQHRYHDSRGVIGNYVSDQQSELICSADGNDDLSISIDGEVATALIYAGQGRFLKTAGTCSKYMICLDRREGFVRGLCAGPEYFRRQPAPAAGPTLCQHQGIAGIYRNSTAGRVALFERDGSLVLAFSPFKEAMLQELSAGVFIQQNGPFATERLVIDATGGTMCLGALHFTKTAEHY